MPWNRKGINNEIIQLKKFKKVGKESFLIIKF